MPKRIAIAAAALALLAAAGHAKPPDLPVDTRDICRPGAPDITSRPAPEPRRPEAVSPSPVAVMGQFFEALAGNLGAAIGVGAYPAAQEQDPPARSASRMLEIGRECELSTRLCKGSHRGRKARAESRRRDRHDHDFGIVDRHQRTRIWTRRSFAKRSDCPVGCSAG